MSKPRVLVVGASIAGPTCAYFLAKAGCSITVIERFPSLRTNGQNIDIRTSGVAVMGKIPGMEESVRAKVLKMEGMSIVRANGTPYGTITPTGNPEQQALISEYEIFRGDLSKILYDLTANNEDVNYVFNEQVTSIQQSGNEDGPVTVEFLNGHPTQQYDLIVACDGAQSRTRALGLSCGSRDHVVPTNCWAAYFSLPTDLINGSKIAQGFTAPKGRALFIDSNGEKGCRVGLMCINPVNYPDATTSFREAQKTGMDALKTAISEHYAGVGWKAEEAMKGMMKSNDLYWSESVQVKTPILSKGRFVLVGDAGYAPGFTGTGTTLALTGGYILAGEISKHKGDFAAGLAGYERTMRPFITEMQKVPPGVPGILAPYSSWGISIRNSIFWVLTNTGIINVAQNMFGGAAGAGGERFKIPDYKWAC